MENKENLFCTPMMRPLEDQEMPDLDRPTKRRRINTKRKDVVREKLNDKFGKFIIIINSILQINLVIRKFEYVIFHKYWFWRALQCAF